MKSEERGWRRREYKREDNSSTVAIPRIEELHRSWII